MARSENEEPSVDLLNNWIWINYSRSPTDSEWRIIITNLLISAGLNNYNHPAHHLRGVTSNNSMTIMNGRPNHHQTRYERMNHKPLIVGPDLLASWRLCPIWTIKLFFLLWLLLLQHKPPHTECNEIMKLIEGNPPEMHTDMPWRRRRYGEERKCPPDKTNIVTFGLTLLLLRVTLIVRAAAF